jgi:hypothetical protein
MIRIVTEAEKGMPYLGSRDLLSCKLLSFPAAGDPDKSIGRNHLSSIKSQQSSLVDALVMPSLWVEVSREGVGGSTAVRHGL